MTEQVTDPTAPTGKETAPQAPSSKAEGAKTAQEGDDFETLKWNGKELKVPRSQVKNLAQMGYDYEAKMRSVKEERAKLEAERDEYQAFRDYKEYLSKYPDKAQKIYNVLLGTEQQQNDALDADGLEPPRVASPDGADSLKMQRIEKELLALREQNQRLALERQTESLMSKIDDEIKGDAVLADSPDLARRHILAMLQAAPESDISVVAARTKADLLEYQKKALQKYAARKQGQAEDFGPSLPGGGSPPAPQKPSFTGKDLKSGNVRREALAFIGRAWDKASSV